LDVGGAGDEEMGLDELAAVVDAAGGEALDFDEGVLPGGGGRGGGIEADVEELLAEGDGEAGLIFVEGGGAADDAADADELVVEAAGGEVVEGGILGGRGGAVGEDFDLGGFDAGEVEAFEGGAPDADEVADEEIGDPGLGAEEGAGVGVLDEDSGGVGNVGDAGLEVDGEGLLGLFEGQGADGGGGGEGLLGEEGAAERQGEEEGMHWGAVIWLAVVGEGRVGSGVMQITRFLPVVALVFTLQAGAWALEPAHEKAIEELLELSNTAKSYEASVIGAFESSIANSAAQLPPDQKPKFDRAMTRVKDLMLAKMGWATMKPEIVALYGATFSQAELDAVLPLMRDPAMKAFVAKSAPLAAEAAKMGGDKAKALQSEIMTIVQEEMAK